MKNRVHAELFQHGIPPVGRALFAPDVSTGTAAHIAGRPLTTGKVVGPAAASSVRRAN
ncbi:MAG TPA: hypothetical protein VE570_10235 [Thermoleophilaceae bacterium]|nr:hypothetical protein [Thermoleophilaceae bacterium]